MRRQKLSYNASKKSFRRNAGHHSKNNMSNPMRGGIRL